MPSLLLVVLLVQLAIHLVNTFGVAVINTLAWNLYNCLPTPTAKQFKEQNKLQADYVALRRQLNATSAQNEFSKWAKLQRHVDKMTVQLEKQKTALESQKANFDKMVGAGRWLATNGLRMFLQFWYSKQAMFWLPHGFVPYYGEWLLSFPRAPLGSVSIQAWGLACGTAVLLVNDAIGALVGLAMEAKNKPTQEKKQPMRMASEKTQSEKTEVKGL